MESQQHEMYVKSQKNTRLSMLYWPNNRWILEILENTSQVLKSKMQKRQIPCGHRDPPKCPPKSFKSTSSTLGSFSKLGTHTAKTSWNSGDESSFISPMMGEGHRISEFIQNTPIISPDWNLRNWDANFLAEVYWHLQYAWLPICWYLQPAWSVPLDTLGFGTFKNLRWMLPSCQMISLPSMIGFWFHQAKIDTASTKTPLTDAEYRFTMIHVCSWTQRTGICKLWRSFRVHCF